MVNIYDSENFAKGNALADAAHEAMEAVDTAIANGAPADEIATLTAIADEALAAFLAH